MTNTPTSQALSILVRSSPHLGPPRLVSVRLLKRSVFSYPLPFA